MKRFAKYFNNLTIAQKIQYFTGILITVLIVTMFFFAESIAHKLVIGKAIHLTETNLTEVSDYFDKLNDNLEERTSHLVKSLTIQQFLKDPKSKNHSASIFDVYTILSYRISSLVKEISTDPNIYSLGIFNDGGHLLFLDQKGLLETTSGRPLDDQIMKQIKNSEQKLLWTSANELNSVITNEQADETLSVTRLIYDLEDTRAIIGMVSTSINTGQLSRIYNEIGFNRSAQIVITSSSGRILLPFERSEVSNYLKQASFNDYIENEFEGLKHYHYLGKEYIVMSQFLTDQNLFVSAFLPYDELIQEKRQISSLIYIIAAIIIVLEILFTLVMRKSIAKPVGQLAKMMTTIGQGDLQVRAKFDRRDEIGMLADSMDEMLDRIVSLMNELVTAQKTKRELEFKALQSQINPHFLYNSLESVSALAQLDRNDDLYTMSRSLAFFYKGVLSSGRSFVTLAEELDITENYLKIQSIRYGGKISFRILMPEAMAGLKMVKLSIQPLVENSIYHGLKHINRRGRILIRCFSQGENAIIAIYDNGQGFEVSDTIFQEEQEPSLSIKRKGFGLASIDKRLKLCFGEVYGLKLESKPGYWTRVEMLIPNNPEESRPSL